MKRQAHLVMLSFAVAVAMLATSCGTGSGDADKAGGPGKPVVLRMATVNGDLEFTPQIQYLVDRVEELSEGNLKIEIRYEVGSFADYAEQQVVRGVAGGRFDLGFVGTQVFDSLGVDSFQALMAPMLIDSYPLQSAVVQSAIADQMMQGLDGVGVTGLGILAGALRKPVSVKQPLLRPADWRGIRFATFRSEVQAQAIRALAASPLPIIGDSRDEALEKGSIDGFESSLLAYQINAQQQAAPYVAANVNLWPQTLAVVVNPDVIADLTADQRAWLEDAADVAASRSATLADSDTRNIRTLCEAGAWFANASEADLVALEESFSPVYTSLQQNPETKTYIEQIQQLKHSTTPEAALAIPEGCAGTSPELATPAEGSTPAYLNGSYRYTITKEDAIREDRGDPAYYPSTHTVTLEDGKFSIRGPHGGFSGTYGVEKDQIAFQISKSGHSVVVVSFTFTVDDDGDLHLKPVQPMDPGTAFEFAVHPWTKIG
jgi:TRAP-type C4-dicarboxylate transport system substrate-binding protein